MELVDLPTMPLELLAIAHLFDRRLLAEPVEHCRSVGDGDWIFEFESRHARRGSFYSQICLVRCDADSNSAFLVDDK